jgi:succinate dehydrogenase/fumarate reductase iron-sulfur protein
VVLRVFRWSPEAAASRFEAYPVEVGEGTTVLDALVRLRETAVPELAFRYACRVGMCGSCAMVVNGRERWACRTRLRTLGAGTVTLRPLYHFPLVRDLVVDMAPFVAKMRAVGAAFQPRDPAPAAVARIPAGDRQRAAVDAALECIGCGACVSACTLVRLDPAFPGPAALNRAFTLLADPRGAGATGARWAAVFGEDGVVRCHGQAQCTAVCPMELSPTDSILRLRRRAIGSLFLNS